MSRLKLIPLTGIPREPDAVAWLSPWEIATADEGDLDGGSRGFSLFGLDGRLNFSSGNTVEHEMVRLGHYPESRSEDKGSEPEGNEYSPKQASGYQRECIMMRHHGFSNSSIYKVTPQQAAGNQ